MKTTIEITDSLMREAKNCARERGVTLRQILEEGLRTVVERSKKPATEFRLRDGSFGGPEPANELPWAEVRRLIYEDRGE